MSTQLTFGAFNQVLHALVIGGYVAVKYLWPVWLLIIALWLFTRGLRWLGGFLGFSPPPPRKPSGTPARPRR